MEWIRHTNMDEASFAPAFALYEQSFPLHEQRFAAQQAQAMGDPRFFCESVWENGELLALLFSWRLEDICYVEHYAVNSSLRGGGLGSQILREFCQREGKVVLEIDPLVDEISRRRKGFYERLGFCANPWPHAHPPYRKANAPHELIVMSWPRELSREEYGRFYRALAREVMAYAEH